MVKKLRLREAKSLARGETLGLIGSRAYLSVRGRECYWVCALLRVCLTGPLSATTDADGTAFLWLKKAVKAANLGTRF